MLYVDEIFLSIQGESTDSGRPCTFVRLYGCNIGCKYCDQPQGREDKHKMSLDRVEDIIRKFGCRYICITGGEPLMQEEVYTLIYDLVAQDYEVSIETSGCYPIPYDNYGRSFKYVMDIKCPSSGVSNKNIYENLFNLNSKDEVKFVISDREDYDFAKQVLRKYPTTAKVLFSPVYNEYNRSVVGSSLVTWLCNDKIDNARVQIQIHKVLGVL